MALGLVALTAAGSAVAAAASGCRFCGPPTLLARCSASWMVSRVLPRVPVLPWGRVCEGHRRTDGGRALERRQVVARDDRDHGSDGGRRLLRLEGRLHGRRARSGRCIDPRGCWRRAGTARAVAALKSFRPIGGTGEASSTVSPALPRVHDHRRRGYLKDGKTEVTLAERWNGTEWSIQRTPQPAGAVDSGLSASRAHRRVSAPPWGRSTARRVLTRP